MIDSQHFDNFKKDALNPDNLKFKELVRKYVEQRYIHSSKSPISVYSVRVGFQMVIGNIPQSALTYWLQEWGYKVEPCKGSGSENHNVYITQKDLLHQTEEQHYRKEWKKKRNNIVY